MKILKSWLSIAIIFLFVSLSVTLFLPPPPLLDSVSFSKAIYDEHGQLLRLTLSRDQKYRLFVPLSQMAPALISATLLQEDQYFRWHYGFNPVSLMKATVETYLTHERRMGASTITMQLARIRYGIHSKTILGKIWQIFRALQIESHYSKNQILEAYLNLAPYGNNIEGVGAASLIYFGVPVKNITLPESLTLAVIPQNPNARTPAETQLKNIRNKLFVRWIKSHPEDSNQKSFIDLPLQMQTARHLPFYAPHFVNHVLRSETKSETLQTTLDLNLQLLLEQITKRYIASKKNIGIENAAILLVDSRDMSVKALIGSADFFDRAISGQVDGTESKRSPGSTLKPFIYALAFDQGLIHPDTVLKDVPFSFGNYNPENFDYDFMGPIHAKDALVLSRNIPAIFLAEQLSNPDLYNLLEKAQIRHLKSESFYGLALALGGAEMTPQELTTLYAMLANEGRWRPLRFLKNDPINYGTPLLSAESSFLVLDILKNTPRPLENNIIGEMKNNISWKTGTSSGYRDAWTVGVIGPYVLTVWIGNFNNSSNHAFVGKDIAAPLFFQLADGLIQTVKNIPFNDKNISLLNIKKIPVCKASGLLPTRYCHDTELTWFIPGKSPIKTDNIYREIAIDKKTGLRACHFNQNTIFKIYEFWPSDLLKVFKTAGIPRQTPPPFDANCILISDQGISPQITSPEKQLKYISSLHTTTKNIIPFSAVTDADVEHLYWFLNNKFLGVSKHDQPFLWQSNPGNYIVRVVDDHGQSDARDLIVQAQ